MDRFKKYFKPINIQLVEIYILNIINLHSSTIDLFRLLSFEILIIFDKMLKYILSNNQECSCGFHHV